MLSDAQIRLRKSGIGSSDIASIVGLNPYAGPIDVWRCKVEGHKFEGNSATERGDYLEPAIARWYQDKMKCVLDFPGTLVHPSRQIAMATPDGICTIEGKSRLLEIKTANINQVHNWGEEGTDQIPNHYLCQVQWILMVTGISRADIAVLLAGDSFRLYSVDADNELQENLYVAARDFWDKYVVMGVPPEPDGSHGYSNWLKSKHPVNTSEALIEVKNPELEYLAKSMHEKKIAMEQAKESHDAVRQVFECHIGSSSGMIGKTFKITYKYQNGRATTDWESVAKELNAPDHVIRRHTRPSKGFRKFLFKYKGD